MTCRTSRNSCDGIFPNQDLYHKPLIIIFLIRSVLSDIPAKRARTMKHPVVHILHLAEFPTFVGGKDHVFEIGILLVTQNNPLPPKIGVVNIPDYKF